MFSSPTCARKGKLVLDMFFFIDAMSNPGEANFFGFLSVECYYQIGDQPTFDIKMLFCKDLHLSFRLIEWFCRIGHPKKLVRPTFDLHHVPVWSWGSHVHHSKDAFNRNKMASKPLVVKWGG